MEIICQGLPQLNLVFLEIRWKRWRLLCLFLFLSIPPMSHPLPISLQKADVYNEFILFGVQKQPDLLKASKTWSQKFTPQNPETFTKENEIIFWGQAVGKFLCLLAILSKIYKGSLPLCLSNALQVIHTSFHQIKQVEINMRFIIYTIYNGQMGAHCLQTI